MLAKSDFTRPEAEAIIIGRELSSFPLLRPRIGSDPDQLFQNGKRIRAVAHSDHHAQPRARVGIGRSVALSLRLAMVALLATRSAAPSTRVRASTETGPRRRLGGNAPGRRLCILEGDSGAGQSQLMFRPLCSVRRAAQSRFTEDEHSGALAPCGAIRRRSGALNMATDLRRPTLPPHHTQQKRELYQPVPSGSLAYDIALLEGVEVPSVVRSVSVLPQVSSVG
jgi:hypothetical protein